jgi:hypothetical protein
LSFSPYGVTAATWIGIVVELAENTVGTIGEIPA